MADGVEMGERGKAGGFAVDKGAWIVEVLRKSDQKPRSHVLADVTALAAVGDLVRFDLGATSWARVIQRQFDYDAKAITLLVEPVADTEAVD